MDAISPHTLSLASAAQTSTSTEKDATRRPALFAGCYAVELGRWWPWSFGEDTKFVTPPTQMQLLTQKGTQGFEQEWF